MTGPQTSASSHLVCSGIRHSAGNLLGTVVRPFCDLTPNNILAEYRWLGNVQMEDLLAQDLVKHMCAPSQLA